MGTVAIPDEIRTSCEIASPLTRLAKTDCRMDTLTRALSGALLARATALREVTREALPLGRRMTVGFFAATFPDGDGSLRA